MKKAGNITKLGNDVYEYLSLNGGYLKGYGDRYRLMSVNHAPMFNIPKDDGSFLIHCGILEQSGLVYILSLNHKNLYNLWQSKPKK